MEHTTNIAQSIFESVTEYHVLFCQYLSSNTLHTNYLLTSNTAEQFVIRLPNYDVVEDTAFRDEFTITRQTQRHNFDIPCLYFDLKQGIKITKYINTTTTLGEDSSIECFAQVAKALKEFHHLPLNLDFTYTPLAKLDEFLLSLNVELSEEEKQIVNKAQDIFAHYPLVFAHNFLSPSNILIRDEKTYFINYMCFGKNIALFDLAYLLMQCKIKDERKISQFLSSYFGGGYRKQHTIDCLVLIDFCQVFFKYFVKAQEL